MRIRTSGATVLFAGAVLAIAAGPGSGIVAPVLAGDMTLSVLSAPAPGEAVERRVLAVPATYVAGSDSSPAPVLRATGKTTITYLFAYTKRAKKASPGIVKEARALIAWMNRGFKKSRVKIRFEMVKPLRVKKYNEGSRTFSDSLRDMRFGRKLEQVRRARDERRADLVTLIRENSGPGPATFCSVAIGLGKPSSQTADFAFSVISRIPSNNCPLNSFGSAVGTIMGLRADRFVELKASRKEFNFGFVNLPARIRTIMATNSECAAAGTSCESIQAFSTPKRKYEGNRIGIAKGKRGAADNARQLNNNRAAVAAYR